MMRRATLTVRIAATAAGIAVAATLLVGFGSYFAWRQRMADDLAMSVTRDGSYLASQMSHVLLESSRVLKKLASTGLVANAISDRQSTPVYLAANVGHFAELADVNGNLTLIDDVGTPLAHFGGKALGVSELPWLHDVLAQSRAIAKLVDLGDGNWHVVIAQPVDISNTGSATGALVLAVPLASLAERAGLGHLRGVEHRLTVLGEPASWELGSGKAVKSLETDFSVDMPMSAPLDHLPLKIVSVPSQEILRGPINQLSEAFFFSGLVVVMLALWASVTLSRRIVDPLARLEQAASSFNFDRRDAFVSPQWNRPDEIGRLATSISAMADRLVDAYEQLDRRSRTLLRNSESVAGVGSWRLLPDSDMMRWSDKMFEILGLATTTPPSVSNFLAVARGEDRERLAQALHRLCSEGADFDLDCRIEWPDDSIRAVRVIAKAVLSSDGTAQGFDGTIQDVTERRLAEERLRAASARIEAVLANTPVGIALVGMDQSFQQVNKAFCQIFAVSPETLMGQPARILYGSKDCYEEVHARALPLLLAGRTFEEELLMRRQDGSDVWVRLVAQMVDPTDPDLGIALAAEDITQRRAAEEAIRERQELFEQVFTSGSAIKLLLDPESGLIVDANPAAEAFYGYTLDQLRHMRISDINTLSSEQIGGAMRDASSREGTRFLFRHRTASGDIRDVEVYTGPLRLRQRVLLMSIIHDVTDRVRNERLLAAAHQELEAQARELARSNAELEQFAYVASHDLRQPLRQVASYVTLLERVCGDKLDAEGQEFIGFARGGVERMDRLIVDLLEYSRIGRRTRPMERLSLAEVLAEARLNLSIALEERGAELTVPEDLPDVYGDRTELVRLFQNLIGNAIKYCDQARRPVVRLEVADSGGQVEVKVADNGIGISPENFERIFGIFQRLHGRDEYEGTGIGLAVCKKIVEHHAGRIWLDSTVGEGTTFHVVLPTEAPNI